MMNILLPTDFSENSRNAAAYALEFFKEVPCTFHLLHVLPLATDTFSAQYMTLSSETQEKFNKFLDWLNSIKKNPDHKFSISYKANYLIDAVREQVAEKEVDLILMGTKGVSNNSGTIIGKNTSDVMMKVKCPVLAISEKAVYKRYKKVLFPTDYKIKYNSKMLGTLQNLVSLSSASIKILELFNSENEPSQEQMTSRSFLQNSFAPNIPVLQTYYPSENKNPGRLFSTNKDVDMIVMAAKNLNICQKLLYNEEHNQIPFINQLPLLVLHG